MEKTNEVTEFRPSMGFRTMLLIICGLFAQHVFGQDSLGIKNDSVTLLNEVVVHGFSNNRQMSEVPAAIGFIDFKALNRFNNTSFLPAVNTIPGVRMEERSPGSYRFAIRGSSLRSPFGVRNVKMYWNGLPLTDGGGNTYLNLLDFNAVSNVEIIKGPGASLYGAGSGGVVLLNSPFIIKDQIQLSAMGGGYGLQRYQVSAQTGSEKVTAFVNYGHQQSEGYRDQTRMRRDALSTNLRFRLGTKSILSATLFYTDLYYQTPGGLTAAQYDQNPKLARTAAVNQKAAVYNQSIYGGLMYQYNWNEHWSTKVGMYGSFTNFTNPTVNNYERRKEYNWGGRTETQYEVEKTDWKGKLTFGAEYQYFHSPLADYDNNGGVQGNLQTDDRLRSTALLVFAQAEVDLPRNFFITLGGSANFLDYQMNRVSVTPSILQQRHFDPVFSPRVALLKKVNENLSVYGSVSKGFSPPTLAEVRPSTGTFNSGLNAEHGINYEAGFRGNFLKHFSFDVTAYDFELDQTIVVQQQVNGQDYYINAGSTSQKGIETMLSWSPAFQSNQPVNALRFWISYTYNHYRFKDYIKNNVDYSGKWLTGVSPNVGIVGADVGFAKRFYAHVTLNFVDKIPVNDSNSQFASFYALAGMRVGYQGFIKKVSAVEIFAGVDNATNRKYSLGNDLNAAGSRYYNAAALRNFYFGLKFTVGKKG